MVTTNNHNMADESVFALIADAGDLLDSLKAFPYEMVRVEPGTLPGPDGLDEIDVFYMVVREPGNEYRAATFYTPMEDQGYSIEDLATLCAVSVPMISDLISLYQETQEELETLRRKARRYEELVSMVSYMSRNHVPVTAVELFEAVSEPEKK